MQAYSQGDELRASPRNRLQCDPTATEPRWARSDPTPTRGYATDVWFTLDSTGMCGRTALSVSGRSDKLRPSSRSTALELLNSRKSIMSLCLQDG